MATNGTQITNPIEFTKLSAQQLDDIFSASKPGELPVGLGEGAAIIAPGSEVSDDIARFIHISTWKGKAFERDEANPNHGWLKNRLLPIGVKGIAAEVYKGQSWFDGKECIVLDYSHTSLVAQWIRDEIRQVTPGIYLGVVFWGKEQATAKRLIHFGLKF